MTATTASIGNLHKLKSTAAYRCDSSTMNGNSNLSHSQNQQTQSLQLQPQLTKQIYSSAQYHYVKPQTQLLNISNVSMQDAVDNVRNGRNERNERSEQSEENERFERNGRNGGGICSIVIGGYNCQNNEKHNVTQANDHNLLVYYDDNLISGSLESLIEHMVPTHVYYPENKFVFSFLLSARLFIRPHELLEKISNTWERQQQQFVYGNDQLDSIGPYTAIISISPSSQCKAETNTYTTTTSINHQSTQQRTATQRSAQNCIRLLSKWIETFPYDFRDERLMQQVRNLTRKCVYIDNALGKQVSRILQSLVQRLTALEQYEEFLQTLVSPQTDLNAAISTTNNYCYNTSTGSSNNCPAVNVCGISNMIIDGGLGACVTTSNLLNKSKSLGLNNHYDGYQKFTQFSNVSGLIVTTGANLISTTTTTNTLPEVSTAFNIPASYNNVSSASSCSPSISLVDNFNSNEICGIMEMGMSCAQLAHQLTAIELERLSHIGPEEFVQAFAKEYKNCNQLIGDTTQHLNYNSKYTSNCKSNSSTSRSSSTSSYLNDMKKTRNLEAYVEWFNRLSYLTATEIVKNSKKKQRVRVIEYWVETARECFNIGNFNSLMAIIAGLNLASISRLKKTWSKVQSAKFSVLEHQMDPTSNFNSYRATLKAAMWRSEGATEERERIIIPFFSLFVKDLYFLNEGCSNRLSNNHINFEKCSQLAKQIMKFNEWKNVMCPFETSPVLMRYLQSTPILNENTLSIASFNCEPPENTEEKDRYKTVKAENKQHLLQQLQEHQQQTQQQQQQQQLYHRHLLN